QPLAAAPGAVTTNMVYIKLDESLPITAESLVKQLDNQYQIKIDGGSSGEFRLVTHYWVTAEDVAATINAFQEILDKASSTGGQV
ncbi:MAG: hypothetical protein R6X34_22115, partial [Chloroflexota bacterium]